MGKIVKKNAQTNEILAVNDFHQAIIDEYFNNGLNQAQAVLKVNKELRGKEIGYNAAKQLGSVVLSKKENKPYIDEKRHQVSLEANISNTELLKEFKNVAFADVTAFLDLEPTEIKKLPSEQRRLLKKVTVKEKQYKNAEGTPTTEKTYVYELNDKLQAMKEIAKYLGFYEADNRQKAVNINIEQLDNRTINNILQAMDQSNNLDE